MVEINTNRRPTQSSINGGAPDSSAGSSDVSISSPKDNFKTGDKSSLLKAFVTTALASVSGVFSTWAPELITGGAATGIETSGGAFAVSAANNNVASSLLVHAANDNTVPAMWGLGAAEVASAMIIGGISLWIIDGIMNVDETAHTMPQHYYTDIPAKNFDSSELDITEDVAIPLADRGGNDIGPTLEDEKQAALKVLLRTIATGLGLTEISQNILQLFPRQDESNKFKQDRTTYLQTTDNPAQFSGDTDAETRMLQLKDEIRRLQRQGGYTWGLKSELEELQIYLATQTSHIVDRLTTFNSSDPAATSNGAGDESPGTKLLKPLSRELVDRFNLAAQHMLSEEYDHTIGGYVHPDATSLDLGEKFLLWYVAANEGDIANWNILFLDDVSEMAGDDPYDAQGNSNVSNLLDSGFLEDPSSFFNETLEYYGAKTVVDFVLPLVKSNLESRDHNFIRVLWLLFPYMNYGENPAIDAYILEDLKLKDGIHLYSKLEPSNYLKDLIVHLITDAYYSDKSFKTLFEPFFLTEGDPSTLSNNISYLREILKEVRKVPDSQRELVENICRRLCFLTFPRLLNMLEKVESHDQVVDDLLPLLFDWFHLADSLPEDPEIPLYLFKQYESDWGKISKSFIDRIFRYMDSHTDLLRQILRPQDSEIILRYLQKNFADISIEQIKSSLLFLFADNAHVSKLLDTFNHHKLGKRNDHIRGIVAHLILYQKASETQKTALGWLVNHFPPTTKNVYQTYSVWTTLATEMLALPEAALKAIQAMYERLSSDESIVLGVNHLSEVSDKYYQIIVGNLAGNLEMSYDEAQLLEKHIQHNKAFWNQGDLLKYLSGLATFSQEAGREAIKDFILDTVNGVDSQFSYLHEIFNDDIVSFWREERSYGNEVLPTIAIDGKPIKGRVEFTHDAAKWIVRGMFPTRTCQRVDVPTGHNEEGTVINPARFGQFVLVNFYAENPDGTRSSIPQARAIAELTWDEGTGDIAVLTDNFYANHPAYMKVIKAAVRTHVAQMLDIRDDDANEIVFDLNDSNQRDIAPAPLNLSDIFPAERPKIYRDIEIDP